MIQLVILLDNIRSTHNVGSILRTCDAAGIKTVICCGSTPYPRLPNDTRDPVVINRNTREISKTALGAERTISTEYINDANSVIGRFKEKCWTIYGLENIPRAVNILASPLHLPAVMILGNETKGIGLSVLDNCDEVLQIPQYGNKESLNVAVAAGIAIYRFVETRN